MIHPEQSRLAISIDRDLIDKINKLVPWGLRSKVFSPLIEKAVEKIEQRDSNIIRLTREAFDIVMRDGGDE